MINTPNNPTGKVFSRDELEVIAELCQRWDAIVFTDEIYEHITYDGFRHVPPGSVPGLEDRTVTISALSKTYAVTGWRVGWIVAPETLSGGIRSVHDFLTVAAPAPLQEAGVVALGMPGSFYERTRARVPRATRHAAPDPGGDGVRVEPDPRRLLRHGRRLAPRDGG